MNIFVGNLSFSATENDVKAVFEAFGLVASVSIKKKSGKNPRGFGLVVMPDELEAEAAMAGLQDKEFMGKPLSVSRQRPQPVKPKKDYKEIKRLRRETQNEIPVIPASSKVLMPVDKPRRKLREAAKKFSQPAGAQAWEKRKGRGTAKPWKKKPGGVSKNLNMPGDIRTIIIRRKI